MIDQLNAMKEAKVNKAQAKKKEKYVQNHTCLPALALRCGFRLMYRTILNPCSVSQPELCCSSGSPLPCLAATYDTKKRLALVLQATFPTSSLCSGSPVPFCEFFWLVGFRLAAFMKEKAKAEASRTEHTKSRKRELYRIQGLIKQDKEKGPPRKKQKRK